MFLYSKWLDLPLSTRHEIAKIFGIVKKGSTEVHSNVIKSDGYGIRDIENALTIEVMQKYLASKSESIDVLMAGVIQTVTNGTARIIEPGKISYNTDGTYTAVTPIREGQMVVLVGTPNIIKTKKPRGKNKTKKA